MLTIGIDISKDSFTASCMRALPDFLFTGKEYDQTKTGFRSLVKDANTHAHHDHIIVCMEWTGVYLEPLCYYLHEKHPEIRICIEAPQHIKRAFRLKGKTDRLDSKMIAEYAIRYADQLRTWSPPSPVVDKMQCLIASREIVKKHQKSHKNILATFKKKVRPIDLSHHQDLLDHNTEHLQEIEREMKQTLQDDPEISRHAHNLLTIPSIGLHCVSGFLVLSQGFQRTDYANLAALLGFAPRPYESGETVRKRDKTDRYGHRYLRRNLHLAAKNACQNTFNPYYLRMKARGKDESLIYNNVSYKLLKRMCCIIRENRPYYAKFTPIPPDFQKKIS